MTVFSPGDLIKLDLKWTISRWERDVNGAFMGKGSTILYKDLCKTGIIIRNMHPDYLVLTIPQNKYYLFNTTEIKL